MTRNRTGARSRAVIYEKRDAVAWVTLNRPDKLNAYNVEMRDALYEALTAVHEDSDVRAMVLAGAGSSFSTGGDVSEFGQAPSPTAARWIRFRRDVWGRLKSLPIPTVAAVHGFTVGGGMEMALLCDVAIAAEDARFCLPETGLGMVPGVAGTQTAPRRLKPGWALDLCITGRWIDAQRALFVGLVAKVVRRKALDRAAHEMALALSRVPREHAALVKLAVWEGLNTSLANGLELERRLAKRMMHFPSAAGKKRAAMRK
ncbi:MAG TPA: enoyl-CoA hydratase/isomerase family protein [Candidatus Binataceae bacterium]|jgi:enoyl-CoA hydratase/carnithine racemase|nr:enoyl-CoA hydratase/isomerase family protein [Candidatus Binataceae bacterium]